MDFKQYWKEFNKKLAGPPNWKYTPSPELKIGDKVQGSFGYSKIKQIRQYKPREKDGDIIYGIYCDDGRSFRLLPMEGLTISRTKDEYE